MNLTLNGRTALVSGGFGLVGFEIVQRFFNDGMNVATLHSRKEKAWMSENWLKEHGDRYLPLSGDIGEMLTKVNEKFGRLDVLVGHPSTRM